MASRKNRGARGHRPERHVIVRGVLREEIDLRKLGRVAVAAAQAEADAKAEEEARRQASRTSGGKAAKRDSGVPKEAA